MSTSATRINPLSYLTEQLDDLKAKGTHFRLRILEDEQAPVCTFDVGHISSGMRMSRTNAARRPILMSPSSPTSMSSTIRTP